MAACDRAQRHWRTEQHRSALENMRRGSNVLKYAFGTKSIAKRQLKLIVKHLNGRKSVTALALSPSKDMPTQQRVYTIAWGAVGKKKVWRERAKKRHQLGFIYLACILPQISYAFHYFFSLLSFHHQLSSTLALDDIQSVMYGARTPTLLRHQACLDTPWNCFSIICLDTQVNFVSCI